MGQLKSIPVAKHAGKPIILQHDAQVLFVVLANRHLASGGADGRIKL